MEIYSWFIPTQSGVEDNANTATLPYDEKVKLDEVDIAKETVQVENELPVKRSPLTVNRQSRVQETSSEEEDEIVFVEPTKPVEAAPPVTESTPSTLGTAQQFSFEPEVIETKIAENKDESSDTVIDAGSVENLVETTKNDTPVETEKVEEVKSDVEPVEVEKKEDSVADKVEQTASDEPVTEEVIENVEVASTEEIVEPVPGKAISPEPKIDEIADDDQASVEEETKSNSPQRVDEKSASSEVTEVKTVLDENTTTQEPNVEDVKPVEIAEEPKDEKESKSEAVVEKTESPSPEPVVEKEVTQLTDTQEEKVVTPEPVVTEVSEEVEAQTEELTVEDNTEVKAEPDVTETDIPNPESTKEPVANTEVENLTEKYTIDDTLPLEDNEANEKNTQNDEPKAPEASTTSVEEVKTPTPPENPEPTICMAHEDVEPAPPAIQSDEEPITVEEMKVVEPVEAKEDELEDTPTNSEEKKERRLSLPGKSSIFFILLFMFFRGPCTARLQSVQVNRIPTHKYTHLLTKNDWQSLYFACVEIFWLK